MAKGGSRGGGRRAPASKGRAKQMPEVELTDSDADLDEFVLGKDKISLNGAGGDSEGESEEEAVYALDEEDEDDSEDEDDLEGAIGRGGKAASLAKQAKYLEQRLQLQAGEDEEGAGDDEQEEEGRLWGANKRAYYDADTAEADDEEALKEEEAEVLRLQREQAAALKASDYGLDDDEATDDESDDESEMDEEDDTMAAAAERAGRAGPAAARAHGDGDGGDDGPGALQPQVEAVAKDLGGLTEEERMGVLMADAPELVALLGELKGSLEEVRHRVGPLLREVRAGELATAEGLSYLEAKHLLLLHYSLCIVFYLMLKAEGRSVKDHPVIERLVQLRAYLERIRPIDKQLHYQIDKLLRATAVAQAAEQQNGTTPGDAGTTAGDDDALQYRPNPLALVPKAPMVGGQDGTGLGGGTGVYKPPKINPVAMEDDMELSAKERRRIKEAQRKALRSSLVQELAAELEGAPEEQRLELPGFDSTAAIRSRQRLEARAAVEEDMMTRVPLSKEEAKRLKAQRRAGMAGHGLLEDFADEVADLVEASGRDGGNAAGPSDGLASLFGRQRLSQKFGADFGAGAKRMRSGDEEMPARPALAERRAKFDAVAARRAASAGYENGDESPDETGGFGGGGSAGGKRRKGGEADEFYAEAKAAREGAKAARAEKHRAPELHPPLEDEVAGEGRRAINQAIEKNRGLTPHRRKDIKNPRKKHRMKFAAAEVRRKGQVQGVQTPRATGYAGEATGIKKRIAKSTRLG